MNENASFVHEHGVAAKSGPVIVHFGCGRLSVGAVLPYLIRSYGDTHRIVVIQRRSGKWRDVPSNRVLPLLTQFPRRGSSSSEARKGDFMPFQTEIIEGASLAQRSLDHLRQNRRLMLLVSEFSECASLLRVLSIDGNVQLFITCAVSSGQPEVAHLLRLFPYWEKLLVFENTPHDAWKDFDGRWHHILVDRICWRLETYSAEQKMRLALCHCEAPENFRMYIPRGALLSGSSFTFPEPIVGEHIASSWLMEDMSELQQLKKRALVNAPHAITALLCYRLLADRGMEDENQYLAPLQEMLRKLHPEWEVAMDHYLRLRAIEVAWKARGENGVDFDKLHLDYSKAYSTAKESRRRFFATNDRLDRLMSRNGMGKELEKFEEHIVEPVHFYERNAVKLTEFWSYGRPNHVDMIQLRDFLTTTFLEATRWLVHPRSHPRQNLPNSPTSND